MEDFVVLILLTMVNTHCNLKILAAASEVEARTKVKESEKDRIIVCRSRTDGRCGDCSVDFLA